MKKLKMRFSQSWGIRLLGCWLILNGLIQMIGLNFFFRDFLLGAIAIGAGFLVIQEK